ncbi:MAG: carboxy-S-adenosyl-L-methionine synthase CmoA [Gammaproteobacteria bacterium]|nr:carboxy-S-adenosyl-L-methionine synthase CmoA [Gammaproteobacteria bacterium]
MTGKTKQDRLYAEIQAGIADFVFDERVAMVFPDMIRRSVPGYATIINMIGALAGQRVAPHSRCYDLGCSLAAAALAIRQGVGDLDCRIIAVDNSPAMLWQARHFVERAKSTVPVDLVCADVRHIRILDASMVVLNFTLQFIPVARRRALLQSIYAGLWDGGILVLSEKIRLPNKAGETLFVEMHHAFKKAQGYSELEISQKRTALDKVLIPESLETHRRRLRDVGFQTVEVWFQCFNFVSLLAIK